METTCFLALVLPEQGEIKKKLAAVFPDGYTTKYGMLLAPLTSTFVTGDELLFQTEILVCGRLYKRPPLTLHFEDPQRRDGTVVWPVAACGELFALQDQILNSLPFGLQDILRVQKPRPEISVHTTSMPASLPPLESCVIDSLTVLSQSEDVWEIADELKFVQE